MLDILHLDLQNIVENKLFKRKCVPFDTYLFPHAIALEYQHICPI